MYYDPKAKTTAVDLRGVTLSPSDAPQDTLLGVNTSLNMAVDKLATLLDGARRLADNLVGVPAPQASVDTMPPISGEGAVGLLRMRSNELHLMLGRLEAELLRAQQGVE